MSEDTLAGATGAIDPPPTEPFIVAPPQAKSPV